MKGELETNQKTDTSKLQTNQSSNDEINKALFFTGEGYCMIHGKYIGMQCPSCYPYIPMQIVRYPDMWQLCPKCNGECEIDVPGESVSNKTQNKIPCKICNGKGIISKFNGKPPVDSI